MQSNIKEVKNEVLKQLSLVQSKAEFNMIFIPALHMELSKALVFQMLRVEYGVDMALNPMFFIKNIEVGTMENLKNELQETLNRISKTLEVKFGPMEYSDKNKEIRVFVI
jgi:hypothetical protein